MPGIELEGLVAPQTPKRHIPKGRRTASPSTAPGAICAGIGKSKKISKFLAKNA
jgi:hypothetical protein